MYKKGMVLRPWMWILVAAALATPDRLRAEGADLGVAAAAAGRDAGAAPPDAGAAPPDAAPAAAPKAQGPARYSNEWTEATLRGYHERYPKLTRLVRLGTSLEGRPLWALAIGRHLRRADRRPAVLLNGAHHGLELMSIDAVIDAIEVLLLRSGSGAAAGADAGVEPAPTLRRDPALDRRVRRWLEELAVWAVPVVNPDGAWAALHGTPRTGRKNGRDTDGNGRIDLTDGVDLNRNYPFKWGFLGEVGSSSKPQSYYYRGASPGSEPETQAMMRLAESEHPAASVSYHTGTVAVLAPYTIDNVQDPTPNEAWLVGEYVVAGLGMHPQGKPFTLRRKIYSVDGTDQDYYRHRFGTLALLVEGARRDAKDEAERLAIMHTLRPTWMRLFDRFLDGPSLSGHVRDAAGRPAVATVMIAELATHESETWSTRCRDGRFDRYLPAPGTYTVRVMVPGQPPLEKIVEVTEGRAQLDIVLPGAVAASRCPESP